MLRAVNSPCLYKYLNNVLLLISWGITLLKRTESAGCSRVQWCPLVCPPWKSTACQSGITIPLRWFQDVLKGKETPELSAVTPSFHRSKPQGSRWSCYTDDQWKPVWLTWTGLSHLKNKPKKKSLSSSGWSNFEAWSIYTSLCLFLKK